MEDEFFTPRIEKRAALYGLAAQITPPISHKPWIPFSQTTLDRVVGGLDLLLSADQPCSQTTVPFLSPDEIDIVRSNVKGGWAEFAPKVEEARAFLKNYSRATNYAQAQVSATIAVLQALGDCFARAA